ncbi:MAG: metal ABC transporter permease [Candidatus Omnitrophica bacterium]|nr:metal ABC transporter permease [Candidatus Omnitrophota bacterium]
MIEVWYNTLDLIVPFEWGHYLFMKNALLAILVITPVFALLGTMVVSNRMAFFTDVLGHSALAGIAIGIVCGIQDPTWPMIIMAIVLALLVNIFKGWTQASMDTVLGVFLAFMVALGITILSREGGFVKYTVYLIGDILAVTPMQIAWLSGISVLVLVYWYVAGNALILTSVNSSLARSRRIKTLLIEMSFTIFLAVVVMLSIRLVGILIINSLLVLPAAASRNFARSTRSYTLWAIIFSMVSGVTGLITSYYWGTASGATIVLFSVGCYMLSALLGRVTSKAMRT